MQPNLAAWETSVRSSSRRDGSLGEPGSASWRAGLGPVLAFLLVLLLGGPALGAEPRGPSFGRTRYRTEIRHGAREDVDDYVSPLIAGERLSVSVRPLRGASLVPVLTLLDPSGTDRTPPIARSRDGRGASFRRFAIDRSGPWTVRIGGPGEGAYEARFEVRPPPVLRFRDNVLGGDEALAREHSFEGVMGATVHATIRSRTSTQTPILESVEDQLQTPIHGAQKAPPGRPATWRGNALGAASGVWTATVGIEEGEAAYDLSIRVVPPSRPRGRIRLDGSEPRLPFLARPLEGGATRTVTLTGGGFSTSPPAEVWFGRRKALVAEATFWSLRVVPPDAAEGEVVDVAVVNPDGQACVRDSHFAYTAPPPVRLAAIEPSRASLHAGTSREFVVRLSRAPGYPAVEVGLTADAAIGQVEPMAVLAGTSPSARVRFTAGPDAAGGTIRATLGDVTASAQIEVVPLPVEPGPPPPLPDEVDLSGWTLRQANSARTFTFPAGFRLVGGETVVVGRAATEAAFEYYWNAALGEDVRYLSADPANSSASGDDWPSINGGETFELLDAAGVVVDGPTVAMGEFGGQNLQRTAGAPAGDAASWAVRESPFSWATPGRVPGAAGTRYGVWISEFSDVAGAGNFVFEFVELRFDGHESPP